MNEALNHIFKSFCEVNQKSTDEKGKKSDVNTALHQNQNPSMDLSVAPQGEPMKFIKKILNLSVSKMAFSDKESEKKFYDQLEQERKSFLKSFWKQAVGRAFDKESLMKAVKDVMDQSGSSILNNLKTSCNLSQSEKSTLLNELNI